MPAYSKLTALCRMEPLASEWSAAENSQYGLEYRLTVVLDIRVVEVANGRVLWKETGISETAPFYSGPDPQYTEANRRAAFEDAVRRLAIRLAQTIRVVV